MKTTKTVVFYGKPGAARDEAQQAMLVADGYMVEARDLTAEHWTPAGLRAFFGEKPIVGWFDAAAPQVVSGEIKPAAMNAQEALVMLSVHPEMICSPLVRFNGRCASGLEDDDLLEFLGVHARGGKPASVTKPPVTWGEAHGGD